MNKHAAETGPTAGFDANWLRMARINRMFPALKHIHPLVWITLIFFVWAIYVLFITSAIESDVSCVCGQQIPAHQPQKKSE